MKDTDVPLMVSTPAELTIPDLLLDWAAKEPERVLIELPDGDGWDPQSAEALHEQVLGVAKGLIAAGVSAGDRIAIMSRTRAEWTVLDFAIWYAGAITVPIYETSSTEQARWILSDSATDRVVTETAELATLIREAAGDNQPQDLWVIDDGALDELTRGGSEVTDEQVRERYDALRLQDLATIIYTSGTTGPPKGVELTHGNFVELCRNATAALGQDILHDNARTLLFMPLAHVFARFVSVLTICAGVPIGHVGDPTTLLQHIGTFRPTFILSVPRVFEKVYNSSEQKAAAAGKVKIFRWAAGVSTAYSKSLDTGGPGAALKIKYALADKLVLHKIRDALGGQVEFAISGGAPLGDRLGHFFRGVGVRVLEGYGLTETTAPVSVNVPARSKIGTVGPALPGISLRIAEDGEILAKGIAVFRGYHNNDEATAEAVTDGWFHTGDLGALDSDGYLRITGRKKEMIVTAGGKNVIPSQLEDKIRAHALISQCVVVGDQRPFIAALLTLDAEMLPTWLSNQGLPEMSVLEAAEHPHVRAALQEAVDKANTSVSRAESVRRYEVLGDDFTVSDYLTPKMSVKRNLVLRDFAERIDDLYAKAAAERETT
ncbi:AMP-dependent synthetase/ligase [Ruania halotolerans]|uniref:AMP-dependent synthetase/ligase n=1 Tax=Ruania halotolerans TaxID=2897773 RepID=UPI001E3C735F|nr:AMP-dependent synthetase/ligase [Ruania halotolerans]UFU04827.1 AMP-dependent synthetase/ligase [Ruania halotolerans]